MKLRHFAVIATVGATLLAAPVAFAGVVVGVRVGVVAPAAIPAVPVVPVAPAPAIAIPAVPAYATPTVVVPSMVVPTDYTPASTVVWRAGYWVPARTVVVVR